MISLRIGYPHSKLGQKNTCSSGVFTFGIGML